MYVLSFLPEPEKDPKAYVSRVVGLTAIHDIIPP